MSEVGRPRGEELLSLVAHQLKTPLAVIAGHSELLLTRPAGETVRDEARYIAEAAQQLGRALDAVLALFAVDTARLPREPREVALGDLVDRALATTPGVTGRRPRLPEGALPQRVHGDPTRICHALSVLLSAAYSELPDGKELALYVEERRGVAMLSLESDARWPMGDSTRLALYVAARLVETDGSSLVVREQGGAVASVVLMLSTPQEAQAEQTKARILVVDDDDTMRRLLRATLPETDGFTIVEAGDGRQALALLESDEPVDLVLLDWMIPGRTGADVLELLRSRHPEVPVIVVTAELEHRQKELAESLGADLFLTKPFSPLQLLEHVERLLPGRAVDPARSDV